MSFLAWAFAAAGLAVAFPLLFHLIRKTPRGRQEFSSLMFLKPSPPRITRRSRLDNLLLLLIRAGVVVLLAIAFMRPFFRPADQFGAEPFAYRRIAILVDTSASMRRPGVWPAATERINRLLDDLQPGDDVALIGFDGTLTTAIDFGAAESMDLPTVQKADLIREQLRGLSPGWGDTDLGRALSEVADRLQAIPGDDSSQPLLQIDLVSDVQSGASIDALQAYEWPRNVRLNVHRVDSGQASNATVRLLETMESDSTTDQYRVRVYNDTLSTSDQFFVGWGGPQEEPAREQEIPFYVAPGSTRILEVPRNVEQLQADRIVMRGDSVDFDNTFFVAPVKRRSFSVRYIGADDANDPEGMLFYLKRCFLQSSRQQVSVEAWNAGEDMTSLNRDATDLVVVTSSIDQTWVEPLRQFVEAGGGLLIVLQDDEQANDLAGLAGIESVSEPLDAGQFALLAEIDFQHPLLQVFNAPQYSDFTNIHFWRHVPTRLVEDNMQVLGRFDSGDPALWEHRLGTGKVWTFASGWQPQHSQLALSTKFVPLMNTMLQLASGTISRIERCQVNQPFELPDWEMEEEAQVIKPDGSTVLVSPGTDFFRQTDQPGIYQVAVPGSEPFSVAVNLRPAESRVAPMNSAQLEALGVSLGEQPTRRAQATEAQRIRDAELEGRQKIWKWLIFSALILVIVETIVAAWTTRSSNLQPAAA